MLKKEGAPLASSFGRDDGLLIQPSSTHFTEVETEVWGGKEAAKARNSQAPYLLSCS